MIGPGSCETNTVTDTVTVNSDNTSKEKVVGEKRKRHTFTCTHTTDLEVQLEKFCPPSWTPFYGEDLLNFCPPSLTPCYGEDLSPHVVTVLTWEGGGNTLM
jgi:hypothetical protein